MSAESSITNVSASASDGGEDRRAGKAQLLLCCPVLFLFTVAACIAQVGFRHDELLRPERITTWKRTNGEMFDSGFFGSNGERLIYQTLPAADYSGGGVYFVGSSAMHRSLMMWKFPSHTANYCIEGGNHTYEAQLIQYLVGQDNLLKAGGGKTCIITELSIGDAWHTEASGLFWKDCFTRYGMFTYDPRYGLSPVAMPEWRREAKLFGIRTTIFWDWAFRRKGLFADRVDPIQQLIKRHDVTATRQYWMDRLGPDWQAGMDAELQEYSNTVDYLQARHVRVAAVYLPIASWSDGFAPAIRYREKALSICASKGVPVLDLVHAVPDADFVELDSPGL